MGLLYGLYIGRFLLSGSRASPSGNVTSFGRARSPVPTVSTRSSEGVGLYEFEVIKALLEAGASLDDVCTDRIGSGSMLKAPSMSGREMVQEMLSAEQLSILGDLLSRPKRRHSPGPLERGAPSSRPPSSVHKLFQKWEKKQELVDRRKA